MLSDLKKIITYVSDLHKITTYVARPQKYIIFYQDSKKSKHIPGIKNAILYQTTTELKHVSSHHNKSETKLQHVLSGLKNPIQFISPQILKPRIKFND